MKAKGPNYRPRTRHLFPDGSPRFTNRLILEDSPYLLQHAHNPVDWYPWGPEAFEKAKQENKPIFLSIGYSTCHWCHVMEEECFEDLEIAKYLNDHFVSIKVDREQRPDIDTIYMTALLLLNRSGGWPMSSFLTPEGKTFYAGTYFPPQHFLRLLQQINNVWKNNRGQILQQADEVAKTLKEVLASESSAQKITKNTFKKCLEILRNIHDEKFGGFGGAPKFPSESNYLFLADLYFRNGCAECLEILKKDLDAIGRSGLHDQVGGGFHRYSTDARWLVPHFEKMLYNQANMARAYLKGWSITRNPYFAWIAKRTLEHVLRDMRSPEGAFYSATDADSEGKEGRYFLWTLDQITEALPSNYAKFAKDVYGITPIGNFEGANILHIESPLSFYARNTQSTLENLLKQLDKINLQLLNIRRSRIPPLRDEKIITAWNGMMITALAEGYEYFQQETFKSAALKAAEYLWKQNFDPETGLERVIFEGRSSMPAVLKDYACLAEAFVHLFDITRHHKWLRRAEKLAEEMISRFWDQQAGGFFMTEAVGYDTPVITRPKEAGDGATPSGNSIAVNLMAMLAARTGSPHYMRTAKETLEAFAQEINQRPASYPYMLIGAAKALYGEAGPKQYGARGKVMVRADWASEDTIEVTIFLEKGFHINSCDPSEESLIPTSLTISTASKGWCLERTIYPKPINIEPGDAPTELLVYTGNTSIVAKVKAAETVPLRGPVLNLSLQVCSCRECLSPEVLTLSLGLPK